MNASEHGSVIYDASGFDHAIVALFIARQFDFDPDATARAMLRNEGPKALASTRAHNAKAIAFLRKALDTLTSADTRIAAAADRALAETHS